MRVTVHYNLRTALWSVTDREPGSPTKGKVIAHLETVALLNPVAKVAESTHARIVEGNRRRVYARIEGELLDEIPTIPDTDGNRIRLNPHRCSHFTDTHGDRWIGGSVAVFPPTNGGSGYFLAR
jgi:hypothetical protein